MDFRRKSIDQKIEQITGTRERQKNRTLMFIFSLVVGLILGGLAIMIFVGAGAVSKIIENAPAISDINSIKPTETKSLIYASDGSIMQELIQSGSNRESVTYEQLPSHLIYAFVAMEDARFFTHDGVDIKGILRALFTGITSGSLSQGASTLTQQLIKNNVFKGGMENNMGDRIVRKLQEQYLALKVEQEVDKKDILTYYLNTINLGSNCLGVQVASKRYFGKDVSQLDLSECTVLAAITSNPTRYNPITHPENNQRRREIVLRYMLNDGYISQESYEAALSTDVYKRIQTVASSYTAYNEHAFSYFTDAVFEDVLQELQERLGYTDTQAYNLLYSGGLRIYSTMDPAIQEAIEEEANRPENYIVTAADGSVVNYLEYALGYRLTVESAEGEQNYFDESNVKKYYQEELGQTKFQLTFTDEETLKQCATDFRDHILEETCGTLISETIYSTIEPQISVVVMDQNNGHVLGIIGGRGDKDEIGSLVLNRAIASTRQPGSCFKILTTYAPALDTAGDTLASTYYDSPIVVNGKNIANWWGTQYMGYANIRFAIMASMNVFAVKCMENTVTENTAMRYAKTFGISTLVPQDKNPVLPLGGLTYGVTNLEMTAAYASIANCGTYNRPIFWTKVTDANGNILMLNEPEPNKILKTVTAKLLTSAMESSISPEFAIWPQYGVGATSGECQLEHMAAAGKSGTTTNANDIWFIGYTPYFTTGVWSGYDSNKSFGASPGYHKIIWQRIMTRINEGLPNPGFDYAGLEKARICSKSGLLAKDGVCDCSGDPGCHVYTEYFAPGTAPREYCNRHTLFTICTASGLPASESCPKTQVEARVYLTIDPLDDDGSETSDTAYKAPVEYLGTICPFHKPAETESEPETSEAPETTPEETAPPDTKPSETEPSETEPSETDPTETIPPEPETADTPSAETEAPASESPEDATENQP